MLLLSDCGEVADQSELFGERSGCVLKCSWTKLKSCLCRNVGGRKGSALICEDDRARIELLAELSLGEFILNLCNVGDPVLLGGSDCPASIGLIMLDSKSVEPYETNVESCVGKDKEDLRRALKSSLLSGRSRHTVYGFSFPGFKLSSISRDVGMFVKSLTSL